jgi:hypothetical protein
MGSVLDIHSAPRQSGPKVSLHCYKGVQSLDVCMETENRLLPYYNALSRAFCQKNVIFLFLWLVHALQRQKRQEIWSSKTSHCVKGTFAFVRLFHMAVLVTQEGDAGDKNTGKATSTYKSRKQHANNGIGQRVAEDVVCTIAVKT